MSISTIAYAFWLGPWLAIVFILLLLIHEMGHVVAMQMKGFETPTPVFIPFLGAAIFAPKFKDRHTEAFVGYGGPLLGTLGTLLVFGLWAFLPKDTTMAHVLLVGSYLGTYLNLFNLLPISPLDGGRITQASGRYFKYIGLVALAAFSIWLKQPVILYVWILVLYDLTILPMKIRALLVPICWVSMVTLMCLGYSDQHWIIDAIDCVLTFPFAIIPILNVILKEDMGEEDNRPDLSPAQRMEWFSLYLGLAIVLAAIIAVQLPLLPHTH